MTERKPADMTFNSWIDKQIAEATERGAFDNLPGAGKPIPRHGDEDAAQSWLREYLRKEGVSAEALLPPPLRLRRAIDRLASAVPGMASEQAVREAVGELNGEIREWRRIPVGPPVFVPLVDEDAMVSRWRAARPSSAAPPAGHAGPPAGHAGPPAGHAGPPAGHAGPPAGRASERPEDPGAGRPGRGRRWRRRRAG